MNMSQHTKSNNHLCHHFFPPDSYIRIPVYYKTCGFLFLLPLTKHVPQQPMDTISIWKTHFWLAQKNNTGHISKCGITRNVFSDFPYVFHFHSLLVAWLNLLLLLSLCTYYNFFHLSFFLSLCCWCLYVFAGQNVFCFGGKTIALDKSNFLDLDEVMVSICYAWIK